MTPEPCELCEEPETLCTCWRCMDCETLHVDDADAMESDTGEMVCLGCWSATDPTAVGDWVTFLVDGDGERLTGRVIKTNVADGLPEHWSVAGTEPVHHVAIPNNGVWAIHPSCIVATGEDADNCPTDYMIKIRFTANRPLTKDELDDLVNAVAVQIEEPQTDHHDATFSTSHIVVDY